MPKKTYTQINSVTLAATASSVTFSGLPTNGTYRDLVLAVNADGTSQTEFYIRMNGDTSSTYTSVRMQGSGSTNASATYSGTGGMRLNGNGDIMTNFSFNAAIQLLDYSATDKHKTLLSRTSSSQGIDACAGRWPSTSAITSVTVYPYAGSFDIASTFSLYGIEA
jgi:hypothetical protein